ncbi:MAG: hypothetical protein IJ785_02930 [Bacteroidales bacterium]|nr:hypothetical protein [Bacteroidales bacterium]
MKKIVLSVAVAVLMLTHLACAQTETSVLRRADQMIEQRLYASAYDLLEQFDPTNDRPAVLLKKEHVVLDYFAQSMNHQAFCLQDLKPGENLDSIRANFETGNIFFFMADSLLQRLLARTPADCALLCGYTHYYHALLYDYGTDFWMEHLDSLPLTLLRRASAVECGCPDAAYQVGLYCNMMVGMYNVGEDADLMEDSAAFYYRRALAIADTHCHAHFNLGAVLFNKGGYAEAVNHFRSAYRGYTSPVMRADAARALGIIFTDHLNLPDSARRYLDAAHHLLPDDFENAVNLLSFRLQNHESNVDALLGECWTNALEGEQSFNDTKFLVNLFLSNNAADLIESFLQRKAAQSASAYEQGLCHFLQGMYLHSEPAQAASDFETAYQLFADDGAPDDFLAQLRQMIDELKNPTQDK